MDPSRPTPKRQNSLGHTAKIAATEVTAKVLPARRSQRRPYQAESFADKAAAPTSPTPPAPPPTTQCPVCQRYQPVKKCPTLARLDPVAKATKIRDSGLCFQCLSTGHISRNCTNPATCMVCLQHHHSPSYNPPRPRPPHQILPTEDQDYP